MADTSISLWPYWQINVNWGEREESEDDELKPRISSTSVHLKEV